MGGLADGLAVGRPVAVHGFPLAALRRRRKLDRAVILMLALAEMLGRGGERVGMPGLAEPRIGRDAADRLAEVLARTTLAGDWPNLDRVGRFSDVVVLSDFLAEHRYAARPAARARRTRRGLAPPAGIRPGGRSLSL